jgi:hypothetical protein
MASKGLPPLQRALEFVRKRLTGHELVGVDRIGGGASGQGRGGGEGGSSPPEARGLAAVWWP